jgi:hypothetical protein
MCRASFALFLLALVAGCDTRSQQDAGSAAVPKVHPDDCNKTSGFFYSELRGDCVSLFRESPKLKPIDPDAPQGGSVFVIFSEDNERLELWLPFSRMRKPVLLRTKKGLDEWADDLYTLQRSEGKFSLWRDGALYYQEP